MINFLQKVCIAIFVKLADHLSSWENKARRTAFRFQQKAYIKNETQLELETIAESLEEFQKAPKELSQTLTEKDSEYRKTTELYFLLKQLSGVYEASSKKLPTQVFNEMRNALDHFIRGLILPPDETEGTTQEDTRAKRKRENIAQMDGHIQRAFLDICKLLCAHYDEVTIQRHKRFSDYTIGYVDNGEYQKKFTQLQHHAYKLFTDAKLEDYKLGGPSTDGVRAAYIQAVLAHQKLEQYQLDSYHKFKYAAARLWSRKGLGFFAALATSIMASWLTGFDKIILKLIGVDE